jgi:hypothetical protein
MFFGYEADFEYYSSRAHEENTCTSFLIEISSIRAVLKYEK